MIRPSDPLALALLNALLVSTLALVDHLHLRVLYGFAAIPLIVGLLPATLIFALRDVFQRKDTKQAFVYLGLAAPIFYLLFLRRW